MLCGCWCFASLPHGAGDWFPVCGVVVTFSGHTHVLCYETFKI